jgi:hypothetical protein
MEADATATARRGRLLFLAHCDSDDVGATANRVQAKQQRATPNGVLLPWGEVVVQTRAFRQLAARVAALAEARGVETSISSSVTGDVRVRLDEDGCARSPRRSKLCPHGPALREIVSPIVPALGAATTPHRDRGGTSFRR